MFFYIIVRKILFLKLIDDSVKMRNDTRIAKRRYYMTKIPIAMAYRAP